MAERSKMKMGDLVRLKRHGRFLTKDHWEATGLIVRVLDGGSHRKNTSYEIHWSHKSTSLPIWHTKNTIELVK